MDGNLHCRRGRSGVVQGAVCLMSVVAHKDPKLAGNAIELPEGPEWTSALRVFDAHVAETLASVAHTLYPHDGLPDRVYRRVVAEFDRMAAASPAAAQLMAQFVDLVDEAMPLPFVELSDGYRTEVLKRLEGTPAFRLVQRSTVRFLYDDIEVWQAFGYEGASVHLGGYVKRGFDDLDWLPDPPAAS
jgi:hypothetical protein